MQALQVSMSILNTRFRRCAQVIAATVRRALATLALFQPPAFEVVLEFTLHVARQFPAVLRQMGSGGA